MPDTVSRSCWLQSNGLLTQMAQGLTACVVNSGVFCIVCTGSRSMKGLVTKAAVVGLSLALAGCVGMTRSELEQSKNRVSFESKTNWKTTYRNIKRGYRECHGLDSTLLSPSHKITADEYDDQNKGVITWYYVGPFRSHKIVMETVISRLSDTDKSKVELVLSGSGGLPYWKARLQRWSTGNPSCD